MLKEYRQIAPAEQVCFIEVQQLVEKAGQRVTSDLLKKVELCALETVHQVTKEDTTRADAIAMCKHLSLVRMR